MVVSATNCSKCGRPKEVKSSGSLTQWIVACTCDSALTAGSGEGSTIEVTMCATCGKRVYAGRSGSFTQWIFRQDLCGCAEPKIIKGSQTQSGSLVAQQPVEYVDENEEELSVDAREYPLERYKPLSIIGEGVSGRVYLSRDRVLGKKVAVKTLRQLSPNELINFQNAAKANSKLNHPRIVQILDFGVSAQGSPFMVMDFVNGRGLDEVRQQKGYLPWETVFTMMVDLCDALGYAHESGILHRDLKPSNMLVSQIDSPHPEVCLIDFGVAEMGAGKGGSRPDIADGGVGGSKYGAGTASNPVGGAEATRRMTSAIVGTPAYMSPDATTGLPYSTRSDIYSLGCIMFECIAGRPPFISDTSLETLKMHAEMQPPAMADVNPSVQIPDDVQDVVSKCLEKRPGNRYHSATDLMIALKRVLRAHERAYVPKASVDSGRMDSDVAGPVSRRAGSGGWIALIATVALVALSAVAAIVLTKPQQKEVIVKKEGRPKTATEITRLGAPKKSFEELFEVDKESKGTKFTAKTDLIDSDLEMLLGRPVQQLFLNEQPDLTDAGCKIISRLPIQHMLLMARKVTDDGLLSLASIPSLRGLGLGQCKITDKGVMALSDQLQTLGISESDITDKCMAHIAKMHNLTLLNVSDCNVSDAGFCQLTQLPLMELWGAHTRMTDLTLRTLASGKARLNCLCAIDTKVSEKGLRALSHMPLTRLELGVCPNVDDSCIRMLAKTFPDLTLLAIDDTSITPASFKTIAEMKKLTFLRLSRIRFKESELDPIMTLPNLRSLDLTNTQVTDAVFDKLAKMPNLKEITCNECPNLTVAGLKKAQSRFKITSRKLLDLVGDTEFSKFFDIDPKDAKGSSDQMFAP